jgi:WhiB family transcriptional regulator, redox-sensing transcriptional regulator
MPAARRFRRAASGYAWCMDAPVEQVWMRRANCRGTNASAFFPSDASGVEGARQVCAECAVRPECLEFALENRFDHGVWGGASERERQRILRERRRVLETAQ